MGSSFGWQLVIIGLVIAAIGLMWALGSSFTWLGRLPGDVRVETGNVRIYFPIVTCIVISVLLTLFFWAVRLFQR